MWRVYVQNIKTHKKYEIGHCLFSIVTRVKKDHYDKMGIKLKIKHSFEFTKLTVHHLDLMSLQAEYNMLSA